MFAVCSRVLLVFIFVQQGITFTPETEPGVTSKADGSKMAVTVCYSKVESVHFLYLQKNMPRFTLDKTRRFALSRAQTHASHSIA